MSAPSRTADEIIADWHAGRADHDPYDEIGGLAFEVGRLRTEVARLVGERDKAREECGHAKAMRQGISEELARFVRLKIDADAELARTEGDLGVAIREATQAREALKASRPFVTYAAKTENRRTVLDLVDAALDKRLTQ